MKKIIIPLAFIALLGYSCSTDQDSITISKKNQSPEINLEHNFLKLTGPKAQLAFEEISSSNEWILISKGKNTFETTSKLTNSNLIQLPSISPINGVDGLSKLGVTTEELYEETSTQDRWLAHFELFRPYAIFFNNEDALNNTYGYLPKYVGDNSSYSYVPFSIKLGTPSVDYDKFITDGKEVYEFFIANESDEADIATQSYSYEQGTEEQVNVTAGVSLGFQAKIGVPIFAESNFSVGVELSSGYSETRNTIKTISSSYQANIPPRTKRKIRIVTDVVDLDARYNIPYTLEGMFEAYYYYELQIFGGRTTPDEDKTRNLFPADLLEKYLDSNNSTGHIKYLKKSNIQVFAGPAIPI